MGSLESGWTYSRRRVATGSMGGYYLRPRLSGELPKTWLAELRDSQKWCSFEGNGNDKSWSGSKLHMSHGVFTRSRSLQLPRNRTYHSLVSFLFYLFHVSGLCSWASWDHVSQEAVKICKRHSLVVRWAEPILEVSNLKNGELEDEIPSLLVEVAARNPPDSITPSSYSEKTTRQLHFCTAEFQFERMRQLG